MTISVDKNIRLKNILEKKSTLKTVNSADPITLIIYGRFLVKEQAAVNQNNA